MEIFKLILRIIASPFVFLFIFGALSLFLGPLTFMLGIVNLIFLLIGGNSRHDLSETIEFTCMWFTYPWSETKSFIFNGKLTE